MRRDIPESDSLPEAAPADPVTATVWPWWRDAGSGPDSPTGRQAASQARRGAALRTLVGLAIAALLLLWKPWLAAVVAVISLLVLALALASPLGLYARFEHALDRLAHGVGLAVTWVLMPILYLVLFLPVGLLLRATGKLRLTRRPDPAATTYWRSPREDADGDSDGGDSGEGGDDASRRWQGAGLDRYRRQF